MTRPGPKLVPLDLTAAERAELERWVRRRKGAQDMALRARLMLACAAVGEDGFPVSTKAVADEVGVTRETVSKWRKRFLADRVAGLEDEPRPGRPRTVLDEQVAELIARTLESKPENAAHWSTRSMAKKTGLSQSTVSRVWRAFGLQPHRFESFKLSTDPFSSTRFTTSSACILIRLSGLWCCAWTRSRRSRPWIVLSRSSR